MGPLRDLVPAAEADHARAKANAVCPNFAVRLRDRHWDRERAAAFVCSRKGTFAPAHEAAQDRSAASWSRGNEQIATAYRVASPCEWPVADPDIFPCALGSRGRRSDRGRRIMC